MISKLFYILQIVVQGVFVVVSWWHVTHDFWGFSIMVTLLIVAIKAILDALIKLAEIVVAELEARCSMNKARQYANDEEKVVWS